MTSSNGNIFWVTGHLWKDCEAGDLRHYRAHYDISVMAIDQNLLGLAIFDQNKCYQCDCDIMSIRIHQNTCVNEQIEETD